MDDLCHCGKNVVRRTSWTDRNPDRRYSCCEKFREIGGCVFFVWIDPPMCNRSRQIIPGLLRRVNNLEEDQERMNLRERNLVDELKMKNSREKKLLIAFVLSLIIMYLFK